MKVMRMPRPGPKEKTTLVSENPNEFGDLDRDGFRIQRGDETIALGRKDWFDAKALVLCLNIAGEGQFGAGSQAGSEVESGGMILSAAPRRRQYLERTAGMRHRFVALEMRRSWLSRWVRSAEGALRSPVSHFLKSERGEESSCEIRPMTAPVSQLATEILQPPKVSAAWACWHHAKALEMGSHALFAPAEDRELFCERTRRVGRERVTRVKEILLADLENPPPLAELGRQVGCSPFYLSRTFREETGVTMSNYLRRIRLDRAAELLRGGTANVTEAATTVGYSSLSHFSKAFAEAFGCCPCLYGRKG